MSSNNSGIGVTSVLTIVFLVMKLVPGNPINDWSWWWVFSPLWIGFAVWLIFTTIVLIVFKIRGDI